MHEIIDFLQISSEASRLVSSSELYVYHLYLLILNGIKSKTHSLAYRILLCDNQLSASQIFPSFFLIFSV